MFEIVHQVGPYSVWYNAMNLTYYVKNGAEWVPAPVPYVTARLLAFYDKGKAIKYVSAAHGATLSA